MQDRDACAVIVRTYSSLGKVLSAEPFGNGYINDTFRVRTERGDYLLQRINKYVFKDPARVMDNIVKVTGHIRNNSRSEDADRCTLRVVYTDSGKPFCKWEDGEFYRVYTFIENTQSREMIGSVQDMYICAEAYGRFAGQLSEMRADELYETIPDFHNTPQRYRNFEVSLKRDACGRASSALDAIESALSEKALSYILMSKSLPLRVTHNDTKLNNILFDRDSGEPVAVVDLDTVMAGYSIYDFGDLIRSAAATLGEDSADFGSVRLDLELFEAAARGFVSGAGGALTDDEIDMMPYGAMLMTYECAIRFLTDYLDGDVYFKTSREGHNLDRARNQFALLSDMEKKLAEMKKITDGLK